MKTLAVIYLYAASLVLLIPGVLMFILGIFSPLMALLGLGPGALWLLLGVGVGPLLAYAGYRVADAAVSLRLSERGMRR